MHIAICDDNVADRKQLERLLEREADVRLKSNEHLYISSFGNITSLMHTLDLYDIFFIDMTASEEENGLSLAALLRNNHVAVPIVLCSSSIRYQDYHCSLDSIIYLDKPIKSAELSAIITRALDRKKLADPTFEIRGIEKTLYIHEKDFLFAEKLNDRQSVVHLTDGSTSDLPDSLQNLEFIMKKHPSLIMLDKNILLNSSYIKKISFTSILLTSGNKVPLRPGEYFEVKKILKSNGKNLLWKNAKASF